MSRSILFFIVDGLFSSISPHNPLFLFLLDGGLPSPVSPLDLSTSFTFAHQPSGVVDSPSSPQKPDVPLSPLAPAKRPALRSRTPSPPTSHVPVSTAVGDTSSYVPTPLSTPVVRRLPAFPPLSDNPSSPTSTDDPVPLSVDVSVETR